MTEPTTVFVATNDLAGHTRGRAVPVGDREDVLRRGVGWVPADLAITAFGAIAPNVFGSVGDLKLLPDPATAVTIPGDAETPGTELLLADQILPDGTAWPSCPRTFARQALADLEAATGLKITASFEHEFMLSGVENTAPFSLARMRSAEPFGSELVQTLSDMGLEPENWLPEFGDDQFEITLKPTDGLTAADRAVFLKEVVRDLGRRHDRHVTFAPLAEPDGSGNGVHIHLSLQTADGSAALFDPAATGRLSELGARFSAGILRHGRALVAFTAPSPSSYLRLTPHRWSAGGIFLAERNREAFLRICPTSTLGGSAADSQYNLEFRPADATANPWLALGVLVRAGLQAIQDDYDVAQVWPEDVNEEELLGMPTLPGSLEEALNELEKDSVVTGWFHPDLLATHLAVKRAEIAHVADLDVRAMCRAVADVY